MKLTQCLQASSNPFFAGNRSRRHGKPLSSEGEDEEIEDEGRKVWRMGQDLRKKGFFYQKKGKRIGKV